MKLSRAQSGLLFRFRELQNYGRPVPFFLPTELNGSMLATARSLETIGLVERAARELDNGDTITAWFLTATGTATAADCKNPSL